MFKNIKMKYRIVGAFVLLYVLLSIIVTASFSALEQARAGELTSAQIGQEEILLIVITAISAIVSIITAVTLTRDISRSIELLRDVSRELAKGNTDVEIHKHRNDEFGELLDDFQSIVDNIRYQGEIAGQIATGDLTAEVKTNGEKDVMGNALDNLIRENNKMLSDIRESTMQVTVGADQVSDASQALAQGATEQASATQQINASMNEIAEKTKVNVNQINSTNELVESMGKEAVLINEHMSDMMNAMADINESSENISKIIKVIDDIAFQTNILALNAAVEAARAGVHGKGFAVVADEVRNLAGKSASAASETAGMIEDSIHKVQLGSKLAEETNRALSDIMEKIEQVVTLIQNIATASNDQATAVTQIDQAISQVSQVTQTNSATSEQCAAASDELSNQAATLRGLVGNFKLKGTEDYGFSAAASGNDAYADSEENEKIISLDGEFGKY